MVTMMTPVIQFLREVATEDEPGEPLAAILENATVVPLAAILNRTSGPSPVPGRTSAAFSYSIPLTSPEIHPDQRPTGISYRRPTGIVNRVKEKLGVTTNRAVGEKTFEFYVDAEIE